MEWPYQPDDYLDPVPFYDKSLPREPFKEHVGKDGQVAINHRTEPNLFSPQRPHTTQHRTPESARSFT